MSNYLDKNGLITLWSKIKTYVMDNIQCNALGGVVEHMQTTDGTYYQTSRNLLLDYNNAVAIAQASEINHTTGVTINNIEYGKYYYIRLLLRPTGIASSTWSDKYFSYISRLDDANTLYLYKDGKWIKSTEYFDSQTQYTYSVIISPTNNGITIKRAVSEYTDIMSASYIHVFPIKQLKSFKANRQVLN